MVDKARQVHIYELLMVEILFGRVGMSIAIMSLKLFGVCGSFLLFSQTF